MSTPLDVTWPAVRDVMRETGLSQSRISQLIRAGSLHAVKTRLGWLIDPESVATLQAERAANPIVQRRAREAMVTA
jgi:hypothetical protein